MNKCRSRFWIIYRDECVSHSLLFIVKNEISVKDTGTDVIGKRVSAKAQVIFFISHTVDIR